MAAFDGKVVLVTGANGDLGTAVTKAFLDVGATVVGAARKISDSDFPNPRFAAIPADVSSESGASMLVETTLQKFGRVDVLAHLVGTWAGGKIDATDEQTFDKMIDVNLRAAFLTIRAVMKPMKAQGWGRILAIGSKAAVEPTPGSVVYAAAKAALVSLIRSVASDVKDQSITANIVLPGTMDTPTNRQAMPKADFNKWVDPAWVAGVLVYLASDAASAVNGAVIPVFGAEG